MLTNKKDIIFEYGLNSLNNMASFARFVSYAEELSQLNELFENESSKKTISKYGLNWK